MEIKYSEWTADEVLGDNYEVKTIAQPADYSGDVVATVIRRQPKAPTSKGVLYIHGFSDYFLQSHMGEFFNANGYEFYAVDLRKYGRSHLAGQRFFEVRNLEEYFPDIEAALREMTNDGIEEIALLGHSTGGLTASLFVSKCKPANVRCLVLNSPFLAWNLPWYERMVIPLITLIGGSFPHMVVRQPKDTRYARSLRAALDGEWNYRTEWKPDQLPDVDAGWVRAIEKAQQALRHGAEIDIPVLVLTSEASARRGDGPEVFMHADAVLDVDRLRQAAASLGHDVEVKTIRGGLHDLALSAPKVRKEFFDEVLEFMHKKM